MITSEQLMWKLRLSVHKLAQFLRKYSTSVSYYFISVLYIISFGHFNREL